MRKSRQLEKVWALCVASGIALFYLVLAVSISLGGLGVVRSGGRFVLRQGRIEAAVNQAVGLGFFAVTVLFAVCGLLGVVLGVMVYIRNGTLRLDRVLRDMPQQPSPLEAVVRFAGMLFILPLLSVILRLFF